MGPLGDGALSEDHLSNRRKKRAILARLLEASREPVYQEMRWTAESWQAGLDEVLPLSEAWRLLPVEVIYTIIKAACFDSGFCDLPKDERRLLYEFRYKHHDLLRRIYEATFEALSRGDLVATGFAPAVPPDEPEKHILAARWRALALSIDWASCSAGPDGARITGIRVRRANGTIAAINKGPPPYRWNRGGLNRVAIQALEDHSELIESWETARSAAKAVTEMMMDPKPNRQTVERYIRDRYRDMRLEKRLPLSPTSPKRVGIVR
jgi:hypothetical protein